MEAFICASRSHTKLAFLFSKQLLYIFLKDVVLKILHLRNYVCGTNNCIFKRLKK